MPIADLIVALSIKNNIEVHRESEDLKSREWSYGHFTHRPNFASDL
jgi:hypothetical protein